METYVSRLSLPDEKQMIAQKVSQRRDQTSRTHEEHEVRPRVLQNKRGVEAVELR